MTVGQVYWANKAAGKMANTGAQGAQGIMAQFNAIEPKRTSCYEYGQVAVWTTYCEWQGYAHGTHAQPGIIDIEGSIEYLDKDFGQCAGNAAQRKVAPSEMLVTKEQNDKVC